MSKYVKVTLVKDFILGMGIDWGSAGQVKYWKITGESKLGYQIQHKGTKSFLFREDVEKGERIAEPNLSYPTGLHFGLELVDSKPKLSQRLAKTGADDE